MEWVCADCGASAAVDDHALLEAMNWQILSPEHGRDGNRALCPPCRRKSGDPARRSDHG